MLIASNIIVILESCRARLVMYCDVLQDWLLVVDVLNMFVCKRIINQANRHHRHLPAHSSERNIEFRCIFTRLVEKKKSTLYLSNRVESDTIWLMISFWNTQPKILQLGWELADIGRRRNDYGWNEPRHVRK